jgi:hypothetical protein
MKRIALLRDLRSSGAAVKLKGEKRYRGGGTRKKCAARE